MDSIAGFECRRSGFGFRKRSRCLLRFLRFGGRLLRCVRVRYGRWAFVAPFRTPMSRRREELNYTPTLIHSRSQPIEPRDHSIPCKNLKRRKVDIPT